MKNILLATFLFLFSSTIMAGGIPTADIGVNAQMLADAKRDIEQYTKQIEEMKAQLEQMETINNNLSGNWSEITNILLKTGIDALGLNSGNYKDILATQSNKAPVVLKDYELSDHNNDVDKKERETKAGQLAMYQTSIESSIERNKTIKKLSNDLALAVTQAEKTDIANKIAVESLAIQNEARIMEDIKNSAEIDEELRVKEINKKLQDNFFKAYR